MEFEEILYEKKDAVARITINRPNRLNAFRAQTTREVTRAILDAGGDPTIGVLVLTGAGDRAFSSGGDVEYEAAGGLAGESMVGRDMMAAIWECPKPVIARVNGYAIGGGQVLQMVCDLAIASENARFGQNGPRVGSFNPGWGTPYMAHLIGQRKAREMWFLCRQYTAKEALEMGLVNCVVPQDKLDEEVDKWCKEVLSLGPGALRGVKLSFNIETAQYIALYRAQLQAVEFLQTSEEAKEGQAAFREKRKPDFSRFRRQPQK